MGHECGIWLWDMDMGHGLCYTGRWDLAEIRSLLLIGKNAYAMKYIMILTSLRVFGMFTSIYLYCEGMER